MIKFSDTGWIDIYKKIVISTVKEHFPKLAKKYYPKLENRDVEIGYFGGNKIKVIHKTEAMQWADKQEERINKEIMKRLGGIK